ncbi:MAG: carbamoyl-phosphate synthase small subunit, partial [Paenibacillus sp.]|nr:carbamoyl-phosphate synthase small subunit [Paenibacillus sp.]
MQAKLLLEDGTLFTGTSFGSDRESVGEVVFNTGITGYQEVLSDPSYCGQIVTMTYPLIGNYGMAKDDYETLIPTIGALVVRKYNDEPSNFRAEKTLGEVMKEYGIAGISGVDTRKLNRSIRDFGSRKALLTGAETPLEEGLRRINGYVTPKDAVSRVSCRGPWEACGEKTGFHVVAIDCGMKRNIVRSLTKRGCR